MIGSGFAHTACVASSPFHIALLSSKTCGFSTTSLAACHRDAYFLQLSKIFVPLICFRSERLRFQRSAVPIWSRPCESNHSGNKKPGVERRASPSLLQAFSSGLLDGIARCSMRVYPVFVTNLTSCELRSPGASVGCPPVRGPTNIRGLYQHFHARQAAIQKYYAAHL